MKYTSFFKICLLLVLLSGTITVSAQETIVKPTILYTNTAHKYTIGGINLYGADNLEPAIVIGLSGLSVGDVISVPGDEVTLKGISIREHGVQDRDDHRIVEGVEHGVQRCEEEVWYRISADGLSEAQ